MSSQSEVNKVLRVLSGKPLKYTVRLLMKDGSERELQADIPPALDYNNEARAVILLGQVTDDYQSKFPICAWGDVAMMHMEKNPEP